MRIAFKNWDGTTVLSVDAPAELWEGFDSGKYNEIVFPIDEGPIPRTVTLTRDIRSCLRRL